MPNMDWGKQEWENTLRDCYWVSPTQAVMSRICATVD